MSRPLSKCREALCKCVGGRDGLVTLARLCKPRVHGRLCRVGQRVRLGQGCFEVTRLGGRLDPGQDGIGIRSFARHDGSHQAGVRKMRPGRHRHWPPARRSARRAPHPGCAPVVRRGARPRQGRHPPRCWTSTRPVS